MKKSTIHFIFFIALLFSVDHQVKAQTTLSAGDIAFTGYNSDNTAPAIDTFSFVILRTGGISAGTVISFTDCGWLAGTSALATAEGIVTWTSGSALPQGREIKIAGLTAISNGSVSGTVANTLSATNGLSLATTGDQVLAFQGASTSPTFISAIHMNVCTIAGDGVNSDAANWDGTFISSNRSAKPPGLTTGVNAIWFPTEVDNARYNCTGATGTVSAVMTAINTPANWSTDDINPYIFPSGCSFFASPLAATQSQVNLVCNGICTGSATVVASGGTAPYTYSWSPSGGSGSVASSLCAINYSCTITDATSASIVKNFTVTQPTAITSVSTSFTNIACNGGSTGAALLSASGGTGTLTYNWTPGNPTGDGTNSVTALATGSWTCTITDANSCTATRNFNLTQSTPIVSSVSSNNAACISINNGSATVSVSGGNSPYTYSWSAGGGSAATATNLGAGGYTVSITDGLGCPKSQAVTIAANIPTQTGELAGVAGGGVMTQTQVVGDASGNYIDGNCNKITKVIASGANPVTGNVTTKVWVENSVLNQGSMPYVARHYEITPATNASTATGTVTLYFLQSEFDAFNTAATSLPKLPTGSSDAAGIANLRIGKYSGTSSDNSGLPSSYTNGSIVIDPSDASIVWNAGANRWEVTFNVSGFSGFVAQSNPFTLPVSWVSFSAEKFDEKISLNWRTATEINASHFIIEHSTDGRTFKAIGTVAAAGNSSSLISYNFIHTQPQSGANFYRILQVDKDERKNYSDTRKIIFDTKEGSFVILVNPVNNGKLQVQFPKPGIAAIYNTTGHMIKKQQVASGSQIIDVSNLSQGVYILKAGSETKKFTIE